MSTRREITRAATVEEIKRAAYDLMRASGTPDVRFADIARAMSMTAPGLYRYFPSREDLLQALVSDAFDDLGDVLGDALAGCVSDDPQARMRAVCQAYRRWGTTEPVRFALLFGLPAPGFVRTKDPKTCPGADRAFGYLSAPLIEAAERGLLGPVSSVVDASLDAELCLMASTCPGLRTQHMQALLHGWASLHGFVCLEAFGQLLFSEPARDQLFDGLLRSLAVYVGIAAPSEVSA